MLITITLEFDYESDRDALDFVSTQEELTKCTKNIAVKRTKSDNPEIKDNFKTVMSQAFKQKEEQQEINTDESNNTSMQNKELDYIE